LKLRRTRSDRHGRSLVRRAFDCLMWNEQKHLVALVTSIDHCSTAPCQPIITLDGVCPSRGMRPLACAPLEHFTRDNVLHDLTSTIADFEPHDVAQTLLVRQIERPAVVTMGEQALMDNINGGLRP
jgi:hypothetical protein